MSRTHLPPYVYQMLDHIYLSDTRAYSYHAFFDLIIDVTYLTDTHRMIQTPLDAKTTRISFDPHGDTSGGTMNQIGHVIMNATQKHEKILLYSDNSMPIAVLVIFYLTEKYHFTSTDVGRIIHIRTFNAAFTKAFDTVLKNENKTNE